MPHILSPIISEDLPDLWGEGRPYERQTIYSKPTMPINYDAHTLKPHSLPHIETSAHTNTNAPTIDQYFRQKKFSSFFGKTLVIKLDGNSFKAHPSMPGLFLWEVSVDELKNKFSKLNDEKIPERVLISVKDLPETSYQLHDPNYVLILSQEAAEYLISNEHFALYGTSWKSTDFNPGKSERPIHNTIFKRALILECLDLKNVKEGHYFLSSFPLPLNGASESPVCPVLFEASEVAF